MVNIETMVRQLENLPGRVSGLSAIPRYHMYAPMFYRTSVHDHAQRVRWIVRFIHPFAVAVFGDLYDPFRAELEALVHDDHEIVLGDIQAGNKAIMTPEQKVELARKEQDAIEEMCCRYPTKIGQYKYSELLWAAKHKADPVAWVIQYADKFDTANEAMHEAWAGNPEFIHQKKTEYGTAPTPQDHYRGYFAKFPEMYPDMQPLLQTRCLIFAPFTDLDFEAVVRAGKLHEPGWLNQSAGYAPYDAWRWVLRNAPKHLGDMLCEQREFAA